MLRAALAGISLMALLVLVPSQAVPAQQQAAVTIEPSSALPGDSIGLEGSGFTGNSPYDLFFGQVGGQTLGQGQTGPAGNIETQFTAPTAPAGTYLVIVCISYNSSAPMPCREQADATLRILAPTTTTGTTPTTTTLPLGTVTTAPQPTTTSSLILQSVTTMTVPDPPSPTGPVSVAFTTTSTSLPTPGGFQSHSGPYPDLEVSAVEVTQGIQDLQNRMPLIANRPTLVRVYVAVDRPAGPGLGGLVGTTPEPPGVAELEDVDGLLHLQRGSESMIRYPDNGPITAHSHGGDRTQLWDTLNFTVPLHWTTGQVTMTPFVWAEHPHLALYADPDPGNNFAEGTVVFHPSLNPLVIVVPLDPVSSGTFSDAGYATAVSDAVESYQRYHPLDVPNFAVITQPLGPGPSTSEDDPTDEWDMEASAGQPLRRMRWLYLQWGLGGLDRIHGLIPTSTPTGKWSGFAHSSLTVAWSKPTETTPGHEAGHQYGLSHAPCKDDDDDGQPDELVGGAIDQTHPSGLPSCSIAPEGEAGYFGTDFWLWTPPKIYSNDPAHPSVVYPFMGYRYPKFADAYHYCTLMETYGVYCDPGAIGLPPKPKPGAPVNCGPSQGNGLELDLCLVVEPDDDDILVPPGEPGSVLLVAPSIDPHQWVIVEVDLEAGELGNAEIVDDSPTMRHEATHTIQQAKRGERSNKMMLRVATAEGHVLALFPVAGVGHGSDSDEDVAPFTTVEVVPWPDGAMTLDLLVDGEAVDSVASSSAPTVTITSVEANGRTVDISWQGQDEDEDEDPLIFSLHWSVDDGVSWRIAEVGITDTEWTLDADDLQLPGGEVRVKVSASDGLNTGSAVTDPIQVDQGGPTGLIAGPDIVPQHLHAAVSLVAGDAEDGPITAGLWESDIDGELGVGQTISTRLLSLGEHLISVTVEDSSGTQATYTKGLVVEPSDLPAPRPMGSEPEAEEILSLGPDGLDEYRIESSDRLPETPPAAGEDPSPAPIAEIWLTVAGVTILAGALLWRRRRDQKAGSPMDAAE